MERKPVFRPVLPEEALKVFCLVMSRVAWMDRVGIHQWNDTKYDQRYPLCYYAQKAGEGELFVLEEAGEFLCVGALLREDVRWPEPAKALYLRLFAGGGRLCKATGHGIYAPGFCHRQSKFRELLRIPGLYRMRPLPGRFISRHLAAKEIVTEYRSLIAFLSKSGYNKKKPKKKVKYNEF